MSASVCKNKYKRYAYAKVQKCLLVPPKNEREFDNSDGTYTCKDDKYLFVGEDSTTCYTKQACPGYVNYNYECFAWDACEDYHYETPEGNECLTSD